MKRYAGVRSVGLGCVAWPSSGLATPQDMHDEPEQISPAASAGAAATTGKHQAQAEREVWLVGAPVASRHLPPVHLRLRDLRP
eukprot:5817624-Pyramimonas_sp.AAC.1